MARVDNNMITRASSGLVGNQIVLKKKGKQSYLTNRPAVVKGRLLTPKQLANRERFQFSAKYAKAATKDPAVKSEYLVMARNGQTAYNVAFADAFLPPVISELDTDSYHGAIGDKLSVKVIDNFFVTSVTIALYDSDGLLLEEGNGELDATGVHWTYTVTRANPAIPGTKVVITATDRPKNKTNLEKTL